MTMLYPIAWACSEGGNVISPAREMVWYGIFDLVTGPLFLFNFMFGARNIEFNSYGLHSGKVSDGPEYAQGGNAQRSQPTPNMVSTNRAPPTGGGAGAAPGSGTGGTPP